VVLLALSLRWYYYNENNSIFVLAEACQYNKASFLLLSELSLLSKQQAETFLITTLAIITACLFG